jgi:hypothetical protein
MSARLRFASIGPVATALLAASCLLVAPSHEAKACGGGVFSPPTETETTKVTGHRVAISISTTQTVLWDQVRYTGDPKDFAWVMPVKTGASLEVASAAWIDILDAGTATVVFSPELFCDDGSSSESSGGCCGTALGDRSGGGLGNGTNEQEPGVTVLDQKTVGPYESVTLSSSTPGAIGKWLTDNGYSIPAAVQPILDEYTSQGFDFIAARLKPGAGLDQMKPLRVVTKGALTTFPMRMLGAGAGDTVGIQLFVITEGQMRVKGFPGVTIDPESVTWDFTTHRSDYAELRDAALAAGDGRSFLTSFAEQQALLGPVGPSGITLSDESVRHTMIEAYFEQGRLLGDTGDLCSTETALALRDSGNKVVDLCPTEGEPCADPGMGEIDARTFACGALDDLAVALTGLHPGSIWVERLEANLPKAALSQDLTLEPVAAPKAISNELVAGKTKDAPCESGAGALLLPPVTSPPRPPSTPGNAGRTALLTLLGALGLGLARRGVKRRPTLATGRGRGPVFG